MPTARVGESSSRLPGFESASSYGPSVPQEQVSKAPPPPNTGIIPRAVLAHARDQTSRPHFLPSTPLQEPQSSRPLRPELSVNPSSMVSSGLHEACYSGRQVQASKGLGGQGGKGGRHESLSVLREGMTQQGTAKGYPDASYIHQQKGISSLGAETWHDPAGTSGWSVSAVPDLIELSPPRPEALEQGKGCQGSVPLSATLNQAWQPVSAPSFADLLRDYNVDESTGLRGVQLAHPRKEKDPIPVIHMPDREYGGYGEQGPPPSLDLLGLDPVPVHHGVQESTSRPVPPLALGPCMPGAMTPFVAMGGNVQDQVLPPPPVPSGPFESTPPAPLGLFEPPPPVPLGLFEPPPPVPLSLYESPRSTVTTARSSLHIDVRRDEDSGWPSTSYPKAGLL